MKILQLIPAPDWAKVAIKVGSYTTHFRLIAFALVEVSTETAETSIRIMGVYLTFKDICLVDENDPSFCDYVLY